MTIAEMINEHVKRLSDEGQLEVLDYVEFLGQKYNAKSAVAENAGWSDLSVNSAMRGMEGEPALYTPDDIIKD